MIVRGIAAGLAATGLLALPLAVAATMAHAQSVQVCRDDLGQITTFAKLAKHYVGLSWYSTPGMKLLSGSCRDQELCNSLVSQRSGCFDREFIDDQQLVDYLANDEVEDSADRASDRFAGCIRFCSR